ncbi:MAG: hypothetical protein Q8R02_04385 [Hyphomonadaceae bacterium]|nr:hypothetical protein [Hyphomonadaceae bacterium]
MIDAALVMFFQAAAGQVAAPPAEIPQTTVTVTAEAPKDVKETCKYEFATGSRVKKVKVCRSTDEKPSYEDTKLQRDLAKNGDMRRPGEMGGGVSSGAGIGN